MKNEKTTATRRNPLLPLMALVAGLCVTAYAFATGNPCEACHNECGSAQNIANWTAECGGTSDPGYGTCMGYKVNQCHTTCWLGVCQM
jgi:hypothetical protein